MVIEADGRHIHQPNSCLVLLVSIHTGTHRGPEIIGYTGTQYTSIYIYFSVRISAADPDDFCPVPDPT